LIFFFGGFIRSQLSKNLCYSILEIYKSVANIRQHKKKIFVLILSLATKYTLECSNSFQIQRINLKSSLVKNAGIMVIAAGGRL
jgi:hypothetical protein